MPNSRDFLDRCESLAVLGGTFDPFHNGHLALALEVARRFSPMRFLFVPAGEPPNKAGQEKSGARHRYGMALASVCRYPSLDVSQMEIQRSGPSYTVDTMAALREICPAGARIYFCVGSDAFLELHTWKEPERLLSLCELIVAKRPGSPCADDYARRLSEGGGAKIHFLEMPMMEISSKMLRERLAGGFPAGCYMPAEAEDYAARHGLYRKPDDGMDDARFGEVMGRIRAIMSEKRFLHTLGTIEEAEKLAARYGASPVKAKWAALLHDCAKEYSSEKKLMLCEAWGIQLDEILRENIDLAHSLLGSEAAKREYGVRDEEILGAIRRHTTGSKGMGLLDKIIYLADFIEPRRDDYPPLEKMRHWAYKNIDRALLIGHSHTVAELKERGKKIHPQTKAALKELKKKGGTV